MVRISYHTKISSIITLAAKRRRKGTVIILCVCVCVCVRKILQKLRTLVARTRYGKTSNYTRIKSNNRLLVKSFRFNKVITIFILHGYCFQTLEDSWEHLDILKHKYSCIMTIASKALHKSKQNLGSGWYNIEHWLQEFPLLSGSAYLKF